MRFVLMICLICVFPSGSDDKDNPTAPQQGSTTKKMDKTSSQITAIKLLDEAYALGTKLESPVERSHFLELHCEVSIQIRDPRDAAKYCEEMFIALGTTKSVCDVQRLKVNTLVHLSKVNPVRAMELFGTLPFVPCPARTMNDEDR